MFPENRIAHTTAADVAVMVTLFAAVVTVRPDADPPVNVAVTVLELAFRRYSALMIY